MMKKIISFFVCSLFLLPSLFSQNKTLVVKVDERTELLGVVCYLADYNEYKRSIMFKDFRDNIEEYFKPYLNDTVFSYAKHLKQERGIGYDAPMSYAINLIIEDSLRFNTNIQYSIWEHDNRWTKETAEHFLLLLNDFYFKTNFRDFYNKNFDFYSKLEEGFKPLINEVNLSWFDSFYSQKSNNNFSVIISPISGPNNYGPKLTYKNSDEYVYSIMGSWIFDSTMTINKKTSIYIIQTLIHEFNHSYCNPMVEKHWDLIEKNSEKIYKLVEVDMSNQAYPSPVYMMNETFVRAAAIKYLADNSKVDLETLFKQEEDRSFFCIRDVYQAFDTYSKERSKYPDFNSFMPEFANQFNKINPRKLKKAIKKYYSDFTIKTSIKDGQDNVSPQTKEIIIKFNREMNTGCNGRISWGRISDVSYLPKVISANWNNETKKEWIVEIELEPNKEYSLSFPYRFFYDSKGKQGNRNKTFYLDFKPGK